MIRPAMKKNTVKCVKILASVSLLVYLFSFFEFAEAASAIRQFNLMWLWLLLFVPAIIGISAYKWQLLLRAHAVRLSFFELTKYYWAGFFFSNFMLSNVGGDVIRLYFVKQHCSLAVATSGIFYERLTGFGALLALALGSLVVAGPNLPIDAGLYRGGIAVTALLLAVIGAWFLVSARLVAFVRRRRTGKASKYLVLLRRLFGKIGSWRGFSREIVLNVLLSVGFYSARVLMHYVLVVSAGLTVPVAIIIVAAFFIDLAQALPIAINGLGVAEFAFVFLYGLAGVLPTEALLLAIVWRFCHALASAPGALFWLALQKSG